MLVLLLMILITGIVGVCVLVLMFGYRLSEIVFLAAVLLPMVWLSRLNLHFISVSESTFVLLWGIFALLYLLGYVFGNRPAGIAIRESSRGTVLSLAALVGLMILSNFYNSHGVADLVRGVCAIMFVVLPFLAARAMSKLCHIDQVGIQRAVVAILLAGNALAMIGIVSALAPGLTKSLGIGVTYQTYSYTRAYSPLGGANGTGMILVMIYCVAFGGLLSKQHRILCFITLITTFFALLTTLARGALVGFMIANLFLLLWQSHGRGRRVILAGVVGLLLLVPLTYKVNQIFSLERLNIASTGSISDASSSARLDTLKTSLSYGVNHIVLGGGWGLVYQNPRNRYADPTNTSRFISLDDKFSLATPHSLPALVLVESGGLALLFLGVLVWSMFKGLRTPDPQRYPAEAGLIHGFRAAVLGFLVVSLIQDNLFLSDRVAYCFYIILFAGLLIAKAYENATALSDLQLSDGFTS